MSTSSTVSHRSSQTVEPKKANKCVYQVDQQVKFIHLQAEVDCLLHQLQNLANQKHDN
ncbi:hypothetical protein [Calothrix rhizosoleniae]|uniref:hypothetical protein n=1 Tax=Calothrix rhizosoleniae TaxID=888997 RepID=UPI00190EF37A|nr:hypothetical protein [Calothrix rhizosoleniae]